MSSIVPSSISASLLCHPTTPCTIVHAIDVTAARTETGGLILRYRIHGNPDGLLLPAPRPASACDGLWQHTCCELFVATARHADAYREFNFSPSGEWAAYGFSAYRARTTSDKAPKISPEIALRQDANGFELTATLPASLLPSTGDQQLGLTTVIEATDGSKSYWALAHGAAQPDFHLRQSFSLDLKAANA